MRIKPQRILSNYVPGDVPVKENLRAFLVTMCPGNCLQINEIFAELLVKRYLRCSVFHDT